jgi:RNA polymerase sigma factor for flagellar operon FliA
MPPKYQQDLGEQLKQYQPLVKRIASRIGSKLPANVMLDDLIQEGMTGLLDALQRYVPQQNQSFEAYASMRIRGAIYDACRKEDILPRNQRDQLDVLEKVTRRLEHTLGRLPTELEIAKEAGVSIEDYFVVIDTFVNVMPIDDVPENLLPTDKNAARKATLGDGFALPRRFVVQRNCGSARFDARPHKPVAHTGHDFDSGFA